MKTKYYYETQINSDELKVIEQTIKDTNIHNEQADEGYYDKSTLWDYYSSEKDDILKKCNISAEKIDHYSIQNLLACESIKAAIESSESRGEWKFLQEKGIIDIDIDRGYAAISVNHPHLEDFNYAFTVEPEDSDELLSDDCKILVWDEEAGVYTDDLNEGVERALGVIQQMSHNLVDERVFNDEKVIDEDEEYKIQFEQSDHKISKVDLRRITFTNDFENKNENVKILGSAVINVEGEKFTAAWKFDSSIEDISKVSGANLKISNANSKSLTLIDYRTGEEHDDQSLKLSDTARLKLTSKISKKLANIGDFLKEQIKNPSRKISVAEDAMGTTYMLPDIITEKLNEKVSNPDEKAHKRVKPKI